MYRVGDYVYFECSSSAPYQIRRIEELNKTPNGNVEAKVMCFYRRRDLSSALILLAGKTKDNGAFLVCYHPSTSASMLSTRLFHRICRLTSECVLALFPCVCVCLCASVCVRLSVCVCLFVWCLCV